MCWFIRTPSLSLLVLHILHCHHLSHFADFVPTLIVQSSERRLAAEFEPPRQQGVQSRPGECRRGQCPITAVRIPRDKGWGVGKGAQCPGLPICMSGPISLDPSVPAFQILISIKGLAQVNTFNLIL
jgi:hypothetical protein